MKYLLLLSLTTSLLFAKVAGFVALGLGYDEDIYETKGEVVPSGLAIIRHENIAIEGNRISYNMTRASLLNIALIARAQDELLDLGLQLTLPLPADFRFQINSFSDISNYGYALEGMIFRRFSVSNLELVPSIALEHNSKDRTQFLYALPIKSVHLEAELLTIYNISKRYNLASTLFYNLYDKDVLQNSLIQSRERWRFSIGVGYRF